jgi:hypothetical protein
MWKRSLSIVDALHFVKARRKIVSPNQGFLDQLETFQHKQNQPPSTGVSLHHLTRHSKHEATLVLKQVFHQRVVGEFPEDVFLAVDGPSMLIREPKSGERSSVRVLFLCGWAGKGLLDGAAPFFLFFFRVSQLFVAFLVASCLFLNNLTFGEL